jgi:uroporphyrinogen-III synthase
VIGLAATRIGTRGSALALAQATLLEAALRAAFAAPGLDAIVFASGSAIRGLLHLAGPELSDRCRAISVICVGETTSSVVRGCGFHVQGEADSPDAVSLAARVADLLQPILEESR